MNEKTIIRGLVTLAIWVIIIVFAVALFAVLVMTNTAIPDWLFFVMVGIGGILTFIAWNEQVWEAIKKRTSFSLQENIAKQLEDLHPDQLEEVRDAIEKMRETFGIEIELPGDKAKRDQIDVALSHLSDSQLLELKEGIHDGSINENDLLDWLNEQEDLSPKQKGHL